MVGDCVILAAVIVIDVIAVIVVFSYVHMQVCCVHDGDVDVFASSWRQSHGSIPLSPPPSWRWMAGVRI